MHYTSSSKPQQPNAFALLPLMVFLLLFMGVGAISLGKGLSLRSINCLLCCCSASGRFGDCLEQRVAQSSHRAVLRGVGHSDIMAMCIIYLLAGAFAAVAKATGGVDATVNLGLALLPASLILPGLFVISAFVATAMGTSMGTIAAIAPWR